MKPTANRMPEGSAAERAYCDYLGTEFKRTIAELGADNVACFFAEPIMGAGGGQRTRRFAQQQRAQGGGVQRCGGADGGGEVTPTSLIDST